MKIWAKSIALGFLFCLAIIFSAIIATDFVTPPITKENGHIIIVATMKNIMFLWLFVVIGFIGKNIYKVRSGIGPFLARLIFIWSPVLLGWLNFAKNGHALWFLASLLFSSIFLVYEFVVVPSEKAKYANTDKPKTRRI